MVQLTPEVITAVGTGIAVVGGGIYAIYKGRETSVDFDDDGNNEVTIAGKHESTRCTEEDECNEGEATAEVAAPASPRTVPKDPKKKAIKRSFPDAVGDKNELTDITGIGPFRAENLRRSGIKTVQDVYLATDTDLLAVEGIGKHARDMIRDDIGRGGNAGSGEATTETPTSTSGDSGSEQTEPTPIIGGEDQLEEEETTDTSPSSDSTSTTSEETEAETNVVSEEPPTGTESEASVPVEEVDSEDDSDSQ